MAIPDFFGQSQQSLQSGLRLGSALQNAESLRLQREQQAQDQAYQQQLRPIQLEQQALKTEGMGLQNQAMVQDNERKALLQDSILLSSLDEEAGKEVIPQLINKYQDNPSVLAGLRELYQKTGKDYIKSTLLAVSAFSGKPIDPIVERKVDIQEENTRLRALEIREQNIDRMLKRETNELKRQELEQKLQSTQETKTKITNERTVEGKNAIADVDLSLNVVNELINSPGLEAAVGVGSIFPTLPGGEAADFEAKLEQLKSQQFLNNIQKMKGLGALSEAEGRKVASAAAALDLTMSDKAFKKELDIVETNLAKAKKFIMQKYDIKNEEPIVVIENHPKYGNVTEEDIAETMRATGMTRDEVISKLGG